MQATGAKPSPGRVVPQYDAAAVAALARRIATRRTAASTGGSSSAKGTCIAERPLAHGSMALGASVGGRVNDRRSRRRQQQAVAVEAPAVGAGAAGVGPGLTGGHIDIDARSAADLLKEEGRMFGRDAAGSPGGSSDSPAETERRAVLLEARWQRWLSPGDGGAGVSGDRPASPSSPQGSSSAVDAAAQGVGLRGERMAWPGEEDAAAQRRRLIGSARAALASVAASVGADQESDSGGGGAGGDGDAAVSDNPCNAFLTAQQSRVLQEVLHNSRMSPSRHDPELPTRARAPVGPSIAPDLRLFKKRQRRPLQARQSSRPPPPDAGGTHEEAPPTAATRDGVAGTDKLRAQRPAPLEPAAAACASDGDTDASTTPTQTAPLVEANSSDQIATVATTPATAAAPSVGGYVEQVVETALPVVAGAGAGAGEGAPAAAAGATQEPLSCGGSEPPRPTCVAAQAVAQPSKLATERVRRQIKPNNPSIANRPLVPPSVAELSGLRACVRRRGGRRLLLARRSCRGLCRRCIAFEGPTKLKLAGVPPCDWFVWRF
jgi:hypothetical protein